MQADGCAATVAGFTRTVFTHILTLGEILFRVREVAAGGRETILTKSLHRSNLPLADLLASTDGGHGSGSYFMRDGLRVHLRGLYFDLLPRASDLGRGEGIRCHR